MLSLHSLLVQNEKKKIIIKKWYPDPHPEELITDQEK
jgi:hypothetical protein